MKNFIKLVLPNRDKFIRENLSYSDLNKIQKIVLNSLNLNNINELRDKFEGVAYYNNFLLKIMPLITLEKFLKAELIDWNNINPKTFESILNIDGHKIDIFISEYGEFPIINTTNENPAIICIKKDTKEIWICGFADIETLNNFQSRDILHGLVSKKNDSMSSFTGFDILKPFKSIDDLKDLLNQKN